MRKFIAFAFLLIMISLLIAQGLHRIDKNTKISGWLAMRGDVYPLWDEKYDIGKPNYWWDSIFCAYQELRSAIIWSSDSTDTTFLTPTLIKSRKLIVDSCSASGFLGVSTDFDSCWANFIVPRDSPEVTIPGDIVLGDSNKTITIDGVGVNGVGPRGTKLRFYSIYKPGAIGEGNDGYINIFVDTTQTDDRSGWLMIEGGNYVSNNGYRQGNIIIESPRVDISAAGQWWNPTMDTPGYLRFLAGHPDTNLIAIKNEGVEIDASNINLDTGGDMDLAGNFTAIGNIESGVFCIQALTPDASYITCNQSAWGGIRSNLAFSPSMDSFTVDSMNLVVYNQADSNTIDSVKFSKYTDLANYYTSGDFYAEETNFGADSVGYFQWAFNNVDFKLAPWDRWWVQVLANHDAANNDVRVFSWVLWCSWD